MKKLLIVLGIIGLTFSFSCEKTVQEQPKAEPAVEEEAPPADTTKAETETETEAEPQEEADTE